mgnify:CR=1 FL=1
MAHNNKKTKTVFQPTLLAVLIGSALIHPVMAEQASNDAAAQQVEATLEVIQVTARKTAENLQQVPVAVTSIGAEALAQRGIENLTAVQAYSPSKPQRCRRSVASAPAAWACGTTPPKPLWQTNCTVPAAWLRKFPCAFRSATLAARHRAQPPGTVAC